MNTTDIKQIAEEVLAIAQAEVIKTVKPMKSSAVLCADEALKMFVVGDYISCIRRSLDSLGYSSSVFHSAKAMVAIKFGYMI